MNKTSDLSKASSDARADRLKKWIVAHYESQQAFINKFDLNQGEISSILRKERVIGERKARTLEAKTDIPLLYLDGIDNVESQQQSQSGQSQSQSQAGQIQNMNYRPPVDEVDTNPPSRQTPVISWVQAGDYTAVVSADLNNVIEWIPYHPRAGQNGFALIVKGASMEPMFNPDDRIYVNPTFQIDELHTGALVVMSCNGDTEATFKELVVEDGNYFLRPLNPNWQPRLIPIDHNCRLVGKVVGKFVNFE